MVVSRVRALLATRLGGTGRVVLLCLGILAAGGVPLAAVLTSTARLATPLVFPLWLVVALAAVVELYVVQVQFRRDTAEFSFSETVLVLLLFFADPLAVVLGLVAGRVLGRALHKLTTRTAYEPVKILFEISATLLEAVVALGLFHAVIPHGAPLGPVGWVAALAAAAAADLLRGLLVELAMRATGAPPPPRRWRSFGFGFGITAASTGLALIATTLLWYAPTAVWLLAVPIGVVLLGYRAWTAQLPRQDSLEFLYETAKLLQRTDQADELLLEVLGRACDLFRAEAAEVVLIPARAGDAPMGTRVGPAGARQSLAPVRFEPAAWWRAAVGQERGLLFSPRTDPAGAAKLDAPGVKDAMAAPFDGGGGAAGVLLIVNRLGDTSRFDAEELRLLETLASHLGVALENARLFSDLQTSLERIHHQAMHDALTGLPNRTLLHDRMEEVMAAAGDQGPAVLLVDLDGFKKVNDSLGHAAGDRLLTVVAERIRRCLRPGDMPARLGGDEFAVLLADVRDQAEAMTVADRLLAALTDPIRLDGHDVRAAGSVGLAMWDGEAGVDSLLGDADAAMYAAKGGGKARLAVFEPSMRHAALARLDLEAGLHRAVGRGELEVHYQPVVAVNTGRAVGVEALVRWRRPGHGLVQPDDFIPLAEETGLIVPIGAHVLREACVQLRRWQDELGANAPVTVSVNLSPRQLEEPDLAAEVGAALGAAGLAAQHLELELTEGMLIEGTAQVDASLRALRALGVRVTIDDFGTGYASVDYLRRFPVTGLKIDRSFTAALTGEPEEAALARAVMKLGQALELPTVAEGVETQAQLEVLRSLRCTFAQGMLISPPLPAGAVAAFLARRASLSATGSTPAP
jgi:diguanylate cyclase (GGDEF)-like protein